MGRGFWGRQGRRYGNFASNPFMGAGGGKTDRKARDAAKAAAAKVDTIRLAEEAKNTELNQPWINQGNVAGTALSTESFDPGLQDPMPEYQDPTFDFQADPGYQFRLRESQDALMNRANSMGAAFNPGTLSALAGRTGEMASDEFGNARARFEGDRQFGYGKYTDKVNQGNNLYAQKRQRLTDRFDQLSSIANRGVNAGNQQQNVTSTSATARADNSIGLANANQAIIQNRQNTNGALLQGVTTTLGTLGGAALGGSIGAAIGNKVGETAGSTLNKAR
jgi:hypothetical protein